MQHHAALGGYGRSGAGGQGVLSFPIVKNNHGVGSLQYSAQATDNNHSQANNNNIMRWAILCDTTDQSTQREMSEWAGGRPVPPHTREHILKLIGIHWDADFSLKQSLYCHISALISL